jgi:hypothetical protein
MMAVVVVLQLALVDEGAYVAGEVHEDVGNAVVVDAVETADVGTADVEENGAEGNFAADQTGVAVHIGAALASGSCRGR